MTERIEAIDARKEAEMSGASFPVDGLTFDEMGVSYNGLPFGQASHAEQLRVSLAMGLAMNPDLRVMLIREGSLLDDAHLAMVAEMVTEADAQVWLERVGKGPEVGIVIEDGMVAGEPQKGEKL